MVSQTNVFIKSWNRVVQEAAFDAICLMVYEVTQLCINGHGKHCFTFQE